MTMNVMGSAVVVIGALSCLNLLLTYAVIRRMRVQSRWSGETGTQNRPVPADSLVGAHVEHFATETIDGTPVTDELIRSDQTFLGFFSTACPPCREELPRFLGAVSQVAPRQVVVVIDDAGGPTDVTKDYLKQTQGVGHVLVEGPLGPLSRSLRVNRYPTMLMVEDGIVRVDAATADHLPAPAQR